MGLHQLFCGVAMMKMGNATFAESYNTHPQKLVEWRANKGGDPRGNFLELVGSVHIFFPKSSLDRGGKKKTCPSAPEGHSFFMATCVEVEPPVE